MHELPFDALRRKRGEKDKLLVGVNEEGGVSAKWNEESEVDGGGVHF